MYNLLLNPIFFLFFFLLFPSSSNFLVLIYFSLWLPPLFSLLFFFSLVHQVSIRDSLCVKKLFFLIFLLHPSGTLYFSSTNSVSSKLVPGTLSYPRYLTFSSLCPSYHQSLVPSSNYLSTYACNIKKNKMNLYFSRFNWFTEWKPFIVLLNYKS